MFSRAKFLRAQNSGASGFTLIEVLVSLGIFATTLLALGIGAASVMRGNQTSYFSTVATNLAQDKLEELKAMSPENITSAGPVPGTVGGVTFTRAWTVTPNSPVVGVKQIDVTVSWTDYTNRSVTVSSAVMH